MKARAIFPLFQLYFWSVPAPDGNISFPTAAGNEKDMKVRDYFVNIAEHLAAKESETFLKSWWRPNQSLKEREYWTDIHQVDTNTINEC